MAFNFTFADNQRLGLQIVGANSTGTSQQPLGFKRVVVDNDNNIAGEVMYVGRGDNPSYYKRGLCFGFYIDNKKGVGLSGKAGTPIFGVIIKDGNCDYIQTGGVAYVQVEAPLTKLSKVYFSSGTNKISPTDSSGNYAEIKGAIAGDPANKITINIKGTPTDLYPVYLNNPHL